MIWGLYPEWFEGFDNWVPLPRLCSIPLGYDARFRNDLFYTHFMPPLGGIKEMHVLKFFKITTGE